MKKSIGIIVFLGFILWATKSYAPSIGGSSIGSQVTLVGVPEVSASTVTGNTIYEGGEALSNKYITSIGDVTSGAAFDGTQGTTFTFFNAGGNATLDYDGTDFSFSKLISTPNYISTVAIGTQPYAATSTTLNTNLNADLLDGESASAFQDTDAGLTSLAGLTYASTSFVKMTGADTFSLDTNTYLTSVTAHNLLSATHGDTAAASPVLGDIMYGNVTPAWTKLAGNTTTTRNFLRQTGTGAVSAVPAWDTVTATDVGLGNVTNESKATMFTSPTFTGTPVIPTPFTLGAVSVLPTGTELNYVDGVTSAIQTQLDGKEPTLTKYNLAGTTNQITLSASGTGAILANNITLSLPQDIATASTPQFARLGLGTAAGAVDLMTGSFSVNDSNGFLLTNTNTGTAATTLYGLKNSGTNIFRIQAYGVNHTTYANLVANSLNLYTDSTAGMAFLVDAAGPITFGTNALQRMTILSDGKVGIGGTPTSPFHVFTTAADSGLKVESTSAGANGASIVLYQNSVSPAVNDIVGRLQWNGERADGNEYWMAYIDGVWTNPATATGTSRMVFHTRNGDTDNTAMTIDHLGYVGIGTTPTTSIGYNKVLTIGGASSPALNLFASGLPQEAGVATDGSGFYFDVAGNAAATANDIIFRTGRTNSSYALTEAMRINGSDGSLGIGMAPSVQFELSGSVGQKASGTTWSNPSDKRLKENIIPFTDGLNVITKVNPVNYELNGLGGTTKGTKGISVIAQDILDVAPYTIDTYKAKLYPDDEEETELYRFEASALIFALINSVKELNAKNIALEARITALENK